VRATSRSFGRLPSFDPVLFGQTWFCIARAVRFWTPPRRSSYIVASQPASQPALPCPMPCIFPWGALTFPT
jgi:hypothetical protein